MICLDSNVIIDFLDPDQRYHDEAVEWMADHRSDALSTTVIPAFEVLRGAARAGDPHFDLTKAFLRTIEVPTFGVDDAISAGDSDGALHASGTPLSARDTLVASQARDLGYALVTRDRDFLDVPGLDVVRYV